MDIDAPPHEPQSFCDIVEADLRRAARLLIKVQDEIDWQLRIATPEGDYHLSVTMPKDDYERKAMLRRLETFMQWKQASAFTLAVEVEKPAAIYATGISKAERVNCIAQFRHQPKPWTAANFGEIRWLPESAIDSALIAVFPAQLRALTPKEVSALEKWFGATGKFPAVHLPSNRLRGLAR